MKVWLLLMYLCENFNLNIVLTGFMGAGKTTVGAHLASLTGFDFVDTDSFIEKTAGLEINDIFHIYGEKYFRTLEESCIKSICEQSKTIISVGGGAILNENNVINLKKHGKIFFLDAPLSIISQRLADCHSRPLIKNKNSIHELFIQRYETYLKTADFVIDASQSISEISQTIISKI